MRNEKSSGIIRLVAGAYLLYISYSLIQSLISGQAQNRTLMMFFVALFIVLGGVILFFGVKDLIQQSKMSSDDEEAESEAEIESEEEIEAEPEEEQDK